MKNKIVILLFIGASFVIKAQEAEKQPDFGIKFSGFVKNDFFMDTRQTVAAREGHFLLWPSNEQLDPDGEDINAGINYNFLAVQSRLSGKITGPDFMGAKTSGIIEGDFFAQANDNINLFRLRHAMIKLNWTNLEILTGQYWNPLFVTGCFPGTVSFNTGTPLQSFARNPQIRLTYKLNEIKLIGAALAQRDYASRGPAGTNSTYLRNSGIPDLHAQIHYESDGILGGVGFAFKSIRPRLSSDLGYKVNERVNGITAIAFGKITFDPITLKLQGRYGQNIADVLSISGYAVEEVTDPATGEQSYTPLHGITGWGEISVKMDKVEAGIFGGMFINMGTTKEMSDATNNVYGLATNIASLIRISPRVTYSVGKVRVGGEIEYTMAGYGTGYDADYIPDEVNLVGNLRFLGSLYYFF